MKLLFIAYYFQPAPEVGAIRPTQMVLQLAKHGWEIDVLTLPSNHWGNAIVDDLPDTVVRHDVPHPHPYMQEHIPTRTSRQRLHRWFHRRLLNQPWSRSWFKPAHHFCTLITPGAYDLIVATGGPFQCFELARYAAQRANAPYVLDYRDLWTLNPHNESTQKHRLMETQLIADARMLLTVSPSNSHALGTSFACSERVFTCTNGYNREFCNAISPKKYDEFALVYTGTFYPPKRTLDPLLAAMQLLKERRPTGWRFHYYGGESTDVAQQVTHYELHTHTTIHGSVSRRDAVSAIKGAGLAVVITSVLPHSTVAERGILTGKLFEAIGCQTPILGIAPPDADIADIIQNGALGATFSGDAIRDIANFLDDTIAMPTPTDSTAAVAYDWDTLGDTLDHRLRTAATS